ncbi:MAG: hypothetical protein KU29_08855 [Sulfurovum sp. FS06-10]|jgi:hypothetical protein|nr:MAG: hypothetical protein KU29_08855 [Sulfurovum sp. FS06-10]
MLWRYLTFICFCIVVTNAHENFGEFSLTYDIPGISYTSGNLDYKKENLDVYTLSLLLGKEFGTIKDFLLDSSIGIDISKVNGQDGEKDYTSLTYKVDLSFLYQYDKILVGPFIKYNLVSSDSDEIQISGDTSFVSFGIKSFIGKGSFQWLLSYEYLPSNTYYRYDTFTKQKDNVEINGNRIGIGIRNKF